MYYPVLLQQTMLLCSLMLNTLGIDSL